MADKPPLMPTTRESREFDEPVPAVGKPELSLTGVSQSDGRETLRPTGQVVDELTAAAKAGNADAMHKTFSEYKGSPDAMNNLTQKFGENMRKYGFSVEYEHGNNRMIIGTVDEHGTKKELFIAGHPLETPYGRTQNAPEAFGNEKSGHVTPQEFGEMMHTRVDTYDKIAAKADAAVTANLRSDQLEQFEGVKGALLSGDFASLDKAMRAGGNSPAVLEALCAEFAKYGLQFKQNEDGLRISFRDRDGNAASVSAHLDFPNSGEAEEASILSLVGGQPDFSSAMQSTELFLNMVKKQLKRKA